MQSICRQEDYANELLDQVSRLHEVDLSVPSKEELVEKNPSKLGEYVPLGGLMVGCKCCRSSIDR